VQRELHARGYEPGGQDGVAGLVTRAAILAFEEDHALPPTAEPSEALLKAILLGGVGAPAPQAGTSSRNEPAAGHVQVVRAVQLHLATLGYVGSKVDGVAGPDTTRAIREFEMDQGTKPIGRITGPLMARLMKAAANRRPVAAR
jgi:peptidoglycan hydrolase-like protein with peptidoglycan-binding domain